MSIQIDFEHARQLIQKGDFDKARQLLKTINHPLADRALKRLDEFIRDKHTQPEKTQSQHLAFLLQNMDAQSEALYQGTEVIENSSIFKTLSDEDIAADKTSLQKRKNGEHNHLATPWHPARVMALSCIMLLPGAGFAFALNWQRLGRSRWTVPTLVLTGVSFLCSLSLIMLALTRFTQPEDAVLAGMSMGLAIALMLTLPLVLAQLQSQAYLIWKTHGKTAMLNHQYHSRDSLIIAAAFIVFSAIGGGLVAGIITPVPASSSPAIIDTIPDNQFTYDNIQLILPDDWAIQRPETLTFCESSDYQCILFLHPDNRPDITVALLRYILTETMNVDAVDELLWGNVRLKGITPHDREEIYIGDTPAILRTYTIRQSDTEAYELQIIAVHQGYLLEFTVHTDSQSGFERIENTITQLYQSIQFLPESN